MPRLYLALLGLLCCSAVSQAGDYMPLVREGGRWVCYEYYDYVDFDGEGIGSFRAERLYRYELRGDTVINGKHYTKCYRISLSNDSVWNNVGLECSDNSPVKCLREENKKVYHVPCGFTWESTIYDFDSKDYYTGRTIFPMTPKSHIYIDGYDCQVFNVHYYWLDEQIIIEGVGVVSQEYGDLLFIHDPTTGITERRFGLAHMENDAGMVLYLGPNYGRCQDATHRQSDVTSDGVADIDDVNAVINDILTHRDTWTQSSNGRNYQLPFLRAADTNDDACVDIEDVNAVINTVLKP